MLSGKKYYLALLATSIVYIVGTLLAPLGPTRFNLTPAKTHVIQITIALPVIFIWAVAVYGAEKFKSYAESIRKYPDGKAMNKIATGLTLLVASVIANGTYGVLRSWAREDGWLSPFTILANYLAVIFPLAAFAFIHAGSRDLGKLTKKKPSWRRRTVILVALAVLAFIYIRSLFRYDYIQSTPDPSKYSSFYMSDIMVMLTIAIPYLVSWWMGIDAAWNLAAYRRQIKGVLYKTALFRLVIGVFMVVAFSICVQVFIAFSTYIAKAGLGSLLLLVYFLLLLYAAGFLLIASGARKMHAIEKVK